MKTNRLIALAASVVIATAALAQKPQFMGAGHAIIKVDTQKKYILLPVEEKEENAHIRVVSDNQLVKTLNCRLATDKVDYFVPFEVQNGQVLDISFPSNPRSTGAMNDFTCWKHMTYSDSFDSKNVEKHRPIYHQTPLYGWMNDPNGMFYKDGVWHLCY